jgi:hypothetical protein
MNLGLDPRDCHFLVHCRRLFIKEGAIQETECVRIKHSSGKCCILGMEAMRYAQ